MRLLKDQILSMQTETHEELLYNKEKLLDNGDRWLRFFLIFFFLLTLLW